jgi:hypothetical protein
MSLYAEVYRTNSQEDRQGHSGPRALRDLLKAVAAVVGNRDRHRHHHGLGRRQPEPEKQELCTSFRLFSFSYFFILLSQLLCCCSSKKVVEESKFEMVKVPRENGYKAVNERGVSDVLE